MKVAAEKLGWRKGPWTHEEDKLLSEYVSLHGEGSWSSVSKFTGNVYFDCQIITPLMCMIEEVEMWNLGMLKTINSMFG